MSEISYSIKGTATCAHVQISTLLSHKPSTKPTGAQSNKTSAVRSNTKLFEQASIVHNCLRRSLKPWHAAQLTISLPLSGYFALVHPHYCQKGPWSLAGPHGPPKTKQAEQPPDRAGKACLDVEDQHHGSAVQSSNVISPTFPHVCGTQRSRDVLPQLRAVLIKLWNAKNGI